MCVGLLFVYIFIKYQLVDTIILILCNIYALCIYIYIHGINAMLMISIFLRRNAKQITVKAILLTQTV